MNPKIDILVVEDSRTQAENMRNLLEKKNYGVFTAEDGQKAMALLKERRFTLILSDIEMPGMNGYELCRRIKEDPETRDIPVILLSVLAEPGDIITGLECGADNFITKPFDGAYLLSWIDHHLINLELRKNGGANGEFIFKGRKYYPASERTRILDILLSTYEAEAGKSRELRKTQHELESLNGELEARVTERTAHLEEEIQTRLKIEKALEESEEKFRRMADSALDAVIMMDGDGNVSFWNKAAEKAFGYKAEEVLGKEAMGIIESGPGLEPHREDLKRFRETGQSGFIGRITEIEGTRKDGAAFPGELSLSALRLKGKWNTIAILRDLTERRRLEEQFRQAQKMDAIGKLAGGVAHDFNNLLTAINGYAGFLVRGLPAGDERRSDAEEIIKAAQTATGLTRQLLAFSRRQVLDVKLVDCNSVLLDTQKMLGRLIGENIKLVPDTGKDLWRIKADPGQLEQIIMNLVVNAKDAMQGGGTITVRTANVELDEDHVRLHLDAHTGPHVLLSISDTGCGMGPKTMEHLFEPFYTTKALGKGTGLGLATVYGIVKQSGGNIYVYSDPGHGTTFEIYFPGVQETPETLTRKPEAPRTLRGSETILLVDDDALVRKFSLRALAGNGYNAIEAEGPEEALRICKAHEKKIDLILSDIVMPQMNGCELCARVAELRPGIKVLYMSGYTDSPELNDIVSDGGTPFLQKPFSCDALAAKVREVLDSASRVPAEPAAAAVKV